MNIDLNNLLKNKTAIECWTCIKDEIEGITERCVPLRKHGKRSRKKHLSKMAIKTNCSQTDAGGVNALEMEKTIQTTEALNVAIKEIRKSKRTFEKKVACNIKQFLCLCKE